jgi:hypothetical protein
VISCWVSCHPPQIYADKTVKPDYYCEGSDFLSSSCACPSMVDSKQACMLSGHHTNSQAKQVTTDPHVVGLRMDNSWTKRKRLRDAGLRGASCRNCMRVAHACVITCSVHPAPIAHCFKSTTRDAERKGESVPTDKCSARRWMGSMKQAHLHHDIE